MAKKKKYRHPTDHKQAEAAAKKLVADIEDICGPGWTYTVDYDYSHQYRAVSPSGCVRVYPGDLYVCIMYVDGLNFHGQHETLAGAFHEALKDVDRSILKIQEAAKELDWSLPKSRRNKKNA